MNANSSTMNNMKILITGPSGCGKSTIALELKHMGYRVVDADIELSAFHDRKTGMPVEHLKHDGSTDWHDRYAWAWQKNLMEDLLKPTTGENIFVCGSSANMSEYFHLFDKIFLLKIDSETTAKRILSRKNNNFGKRPGELKMVLEELDDYQKMILDANAISIDGSLPPTIIAETILDEVRD